MATQQPGVWGIDLGQCALKAIRLESINGEVTATAFDYIEHPKILSQPDADPDELTREALQQFLSRNTIKGDMVIISVPGQSGLARFVKLPPVEEKKIADIVKFEAKQQIPFPLEEVVWDFQKIGQGVVTDGFAMETEIGLFAMKKDMVFRALQQFKDVKVEIHVIQMAPLALCNYVAYDLLQKNGMGGGEPEEGADKKECVVALDIGTDNSNLIITDGEKIIWQRPIPLGGNHFTRALTKDMKLTFAKAEHLKRNAVKSPDLKKILASLKTVLNDFVGEVQRSLGYFTNTHRDATIQYMVGLGNAFRLPGLQKYLQEKLQLEVRKLGKLERVSGEEVLAAPTFTENVMSFAVAYGLALQGLKLSRIQTNLLPYDIRVERLVRGKKPWAVAAAAALLLAVAGLTYGYSEEKKGISNPQIAVEQKKVKAVLARIKSLNDEYADQITRKEQAEKAIQRIGGGVAERFNWQLLEQYINMALPRPNGEKLVEMSRGNERVKQKYLTDDSKKAFVKLEAKRYSKGGDPLSTQDEEFIKKHLIQINIEGINALYTDDLPLFLKNVYQKVTNGRFPGMPQAEQDLITPFANPPTPIAELEARKKLPLRGWVVEIRGYTYNDGGADFVLNTILENLANPDGLRDKLTDEMKKTIDTVKGQISFLFLAKNDPVPNPDPGVFKYIQTSHLISLLRDPALPPPDRKRGWVPRIPLVGEDAVKGLDRGNWRANGETATNTLDDAVLTVVKNVGPSGLTAPKEAGPAKQARVEFVIMFIWNEPLPANAAAAANAPATPNAPAAPADAKK